MSVLSVSGKNWKFKDFDFSEVSKISESYSISETLAKLISIRKNNINSIGLFLDPKIKNLLPNPMLLKDMDRAIDKTYDSILKNLSFYLEKFEMANES